MICPICGTQQRDADRCVQCHTPISEERHSVEEESLSDVDPSLEDSFNAVSPGAGSILDDGERRKRPQAEAGEAERSAHASYPSISSPSISSQGRPSGKVPDAAKPPAEKRARPILVATTQRVEGKRIGKYFGLVHANVVVDLSDLSISPTGVEYQTQFKRGTMDALKALKAEAAFVGANAVVAASFHFHRIDAQVILLSAVGTAVWLEGPKPA